MALVLLGLAGGGCATRSSVGDLERELTALSAQLTEVRVAQDLVSADLARALAELRSLDARAADTQATMAASAAELARLRARLDATEAELRQVRATRRQKPGKPRMSAASRAENDPRAYPSRCHASTAFGPASTRPSIRGVRCTPRNGNAGLGTG